MTCLPERQQVVVLLTEAMTAGARQKAACAVLGFSARTMQRWLDEDAVCEDQRPARRFEPANKLGSEERSQLLAVANGAEFGHLPPSQIVPRLADRGEYIASESTFYRVLRAENQLAHRRTDRTAQKRSKPRALCATAPNQLYSWDITYLPTLTSGRFFYLYLFIDIFSRKIVGWQVYAEESSVLAGDLMHDICRRENLSPNQVVLHSDNGGPMKGATMLATLQALGVIPSFSRPAVSNDNPYSESLFKTLKYRPRYPDKPFADLSAARAWVDGFVRWYNGEHRHSAIQFVTPAERHAGLDAALLNNRIAVYQAAKARHPQRWTGSIRNWQPVQVVHLNPDHQAPHTDNQQEMKMAA
jgi:transposase InsO family protein